MSEERAAYHVGQMNTPTKQQFREEFEGIFDRQFYTNHGPLERALDDALAARLGVRNAVSVVNGTTALMLALDALALKGEVILPAFTFPATVQAVAWMQFTPVFCDVDPVTHMLTAERVAALIGDRTAAILGVHVWGRACDPHGLSQLARQHGLKLIFDAAHGMGCSYRGRPIGGFGDAEIFSFHATKIVNGLEGGCIATDDGDLAQRLRIMRSFHAEDASQALWRMNAKISEAQAAMALLGLRDLDRLIEQNRHRYHRYRAGLNAISGVQFIDYAGDEQNNYQYIVAAIEPQALGMTRDELLDRLQAQKIFARRYFFPGMHRIAPFSERRWDLPVTDSLCRSLIQLPSSQDMDEDDVAAICETLRMIATG